MAETGDNIDYPVGDDPDRDRDWYSEGYDAALDQAEDYPPDDVIAAGKEAEVTWREGYADALEED